MKKLTLAVTSALFMLALSACGCKHEWRDATCIDPQFCPLCEETQGEALGHNWKEATCETAETCLACSETKGSPLGHSWSEWKTTQEASVTEKGVRNRSCALCNKVESENFELESLHKDGRFLMTPKEFGERLSDKVTFQKAKMYYNLDGMYCGLTGVGKVGKYDTGYTDGEAIAIVMFSSDNKVLGIDKKDSATIKTIFTSFLTKDPKQITNSMVGLIMSCDPSLDDESARNVGKKIISAADNGDINYEYNGLNYVFSQKSGKYFFTITVC